MERPRFAQLVIPTLDSVRYEHLLGLVHGVGKAALVSGGEGRMGGVWWHQAGSGTHSASKLGVAGRVPIYHSWHAAPELTPHVLTPPLPRFCPLPTRLQLVGGPGTAKTATIQQFLGRFNKEEHTSKTITFSYLTTPGIFQQAIEVRAGRGGGGDWGGWRWVGMMTGARQLWLVG